MMEYYTHIMNLSMFKYAATILLDFQERYGEKDVDDAAEHRKGGRASSMTKTLSRLFRSFSISRQSKRKWGLVGWAACCFLSIRV